MILEPLSDETLGCTSYIIGDEFTGEALIIDPLKSIGLDRYTLECSRHSLVIKGVMDTHTHADHKSAALELSVNLKVPRYLGYNSKVSSQFVPVKNGDSIIIGSIRAEIIDIPGHTWDGIGVICYDSLRSREPYAVFTGDVLMVGDVGRPDLVETPEETDQLCMALYRSLEKLKSLPDHVELYPSHFGGSRCGSIFLSKKKWSTIGYEKRSNRFLQADSWESLRNAVLKYRTKPPEDIKVILRENMR